jgi:hypothetical protein
LRTKRDLSRPFSTLFLTHLFVLLDEEAQVEAWFGLFGDSANLDARLMHGLYGTYDMLRNQLGGT